MSIYSLPPLDPRLALIASLVRPGSTCADIGTDHGYLPVYLVKSGRCPRALACDVNPQPLEKARILIAASGLAGQVETLLTDGLKGLEEKSPDSIVLAGMGGELIASILEEAPFVRSPHIQLLLQPMTRPEHLRGWLASHGFAILEEHGTLSGGRLYSVIHAAYTGCPQEPVLLYRYTGGLPQSRRPHSIAYMQKTLSVLRRQIAGLEQAKKQDCVQRLSQLKALAQEIEALLEEQL